MAKMPILSEEKLGLIEWESATLDMSFMDDYRDEVKALLEAQRDDAIRRIVKRGNEPCPHFSKVKGYEHLTRRMCTDCWQELERMVK
jgi:hypothetical protein